MVSKSSAKRAFGAKCRAINLAKSLNWPRRAPAPKEEWWKNLQGNVHKYPAGLQTVWGIPFKMSEGAGPRVILVAAGAPEVIVPLGGGTANYLCFVHTWEQIPETIHRDPPLEGLVIGEYELTYADGARHVQHVRARFEAPAAESPGPPWLAQPFPMSTTVDPARPIGMQWGHQQLGIGGWPWGPPHTLHVYAMPNPHPGKKVKSLTVRGLQASPLVLAGVTLYEGGGHPLRHLPRRSYRVASAAKKRPKVQKAEVDLGILARVERTQGPRDQEWLDAPRAGLLNTWGRPEAEGEAENLLEITGAEDATVALTLEGRKKPVLLSLGQAFYEGRSASGGVRLEVLGKTRQWMQVRVIDTSTGQPTPTRIHFSGARGEYLAPYGHHSQININWFEDYGADVLVEGRSFAYVHGEFSTDLPVGDLFVEISKGFEYQPVRQKVTILPGQKVLELSIDRWKDLRAAGWVTADTHIHFLSPQTAWLEGQCEGVNVVNLLATQLGRLFTSVGDLSGRVGVVEDDTIVYVGTENRHHMLGHMSLLGTKGLPVYPMCCGGVSEAWVGDPEYLTMAEWAERNKQRGGVVIRAHFPFCGYTEDPVPLIKGLVDAVEILGPRGTDFSSAEWYRYLNNGYRVAVVGGTDKMGANVPIGWTRTYAKIDPNEAFTYDAWAQAVRAGRTVSTTGPLIDLSVEGFGIGETIQLPSTGGTVEVRATAEGFMPLGQIEIVYNGRVVAAEQSASGARKLDAAAKVQVTGTGWIAARCQGAAGHHGAFTAAHTSPVYVKCGESRAFDGPAMQHMLALVEGGIEYIQTLSTAFDEAAQRRIIGVYDEARKELMRRLATEGGRQAHHGGGAYHIHGSGADPGHRHA